MLLFTTEQVRDITDKSLDFHVVLSSGTAKNKFHRHIICKWSIFHKFHFTWQWKIGTELASCFGIEAPCGLAVGTFGQ